MITLIGVRQDEFILAANASAISTRLVASVFEPVSNRRLYHTAKTITSHFMQDRLVQRLAVDGFNPKPFVRCSLVVKGILDHFTFYLNNRPQRYA